MTSKGPETPVRAAEEAEEQSPELLSPEQAPSTEERTLVVLNCGHPYKMPTETILDE